MSGLCALALVSGLTWSLPTSYMTLGWTENREQVEHRELWSMERDGLHLLEARVSGLSAGVQPGPGAVFEDGWWVWQPLPPVVVPKIRLTRTGFAADYELCMMGNCRALGVWLPGLYPLEDVEFTSC